jgi:hypothetical protein
MLLGLVIVTSSSVEDFFCDDLWMILKAAVVSARVTSAVLKRDDGVLVAAAILELRSDTMSADPPRGKAIIIVRPFFCSTTRMPIGFC